MRSVYRILIVCVVLCLTSCSTTSKFSVYGDPGTEILTPKKTKLATIDNTGKAEIENDDDDYYAFLLTHKPGTNEYIPFALDYKKKNYGGTRAAYVAGMGVTGAGTVLALSGTIAMLAGSTEVGAPLFVSGAGLVGAGTGFGIPANFRADQTNHKYNFKYLSEQKTNLDIQLTLPKFETYNAKTPVKQDAEAATSSKSNKSLSSSSSTKTFKDNAAKIEGTYVGKGTLKQGNEVIETYSKISVSIKKKSKDIVLVNVIESDGSKFFASDGEYTIKKQSNDKYVLTLAGINSATIEIDSNKNLVYTHPRVNIDGDIYKLSINAKK